MWSLHDIWLALQRVLARLKILEDGGGGSGTITATQINNALGYTAANATTVAGKEPTITPGTTSQYWRGDKTWQTMPSGGGTDAAALTGVAPEGVIPTTITRNSDLNTSLATKQDLPVLSSNTTIPARSGNNLYNILDKYTGEYFTYTKTTVNYSGAAITDADVDGVLWIKWGTEYFKRNWTGFINAKWFGATGDGVTNDAPFIQTCLNSARKYGVFFPKGIYRFTTSVTLPSASSAGGHLIGEGGIGQGEIGASATQFLIDGAINGLVVGVTTSTYFSGYEVEHIHFKGTPTALSGLSLVKISNFFINRCTFSDFPAGKAFSADGVNAKIQYGVIQNCHFGRALYGCFLGYMNAIRFNNNYLDGADNVPNLASTTGGTNITPNSIGLCITEGDTCEMVSNVIQFYAKGVQITNIQRFSSVNTRIEGVTEQGFKFVNSPEFRVISGSMTDFILGANGITGIEWDAASTYGVIIHVPITSFTNEVLANGDTTFTRYYNASIEGDYFRARTRVYSAGYMQSPEFRSVSGTSATTDPKITMGSTVQITKNLSGTGGLFELKIANGTGQQDYLKLLNSTNVEQGKINYQGKLSLRRSGDPAATLHIGANANGTAGNASIKIEPSTLLTAIENDTIENNGSHLYYSQGGVRYQLDQQAGAVDPTPTNGSTNAVQSGGTFTALSGKEPTITAGNTGQYWRGDKTWQAFPAAAAIDATPTNGSANAVQSGGVFTALAGKAANILTGYVSGAGTISATDSVLQAIQKLNGNDALKANIDSQAFTGTPSFPTGATAVTQTAGNNSTAIATTAFVLANLPSTAGFVDITTDQNIGGLKTFTGATTTMEALVAKNITPASSGAYSMGTSTNRYNAMYANSFLGNATTAFGTATSSTAVQIRQGSATSFSAVWQPTTGNVNFQTLSTSPSDNGMGATFSHQTSGVSGVGRSVWISSSLTATANANVLVGLDLATTFTNGAFTGVKQYSIRANSDIYVTSGTKGYVATDRGDSVAKRLVLTNGVISWETA